MNPHLGQRALLAIQTTTAVAVLAAAGGIRLAVLSTSAAGAVLLIGRRRARSVAALVLTAVAVLALVTIPTGTSHRATADNNRGATHRPCARARAQICRHG